MKRHTETGSISQTVTCGHGRFFLAAAFVVLLALLPIAPAQSQWPESWTTATEPFQIADDVYYVGTEQLSSFLFATEAGLVLLDAPMQENVDKVLASIRKLGFDPREIRVLIASHGHIDHVGGLASMQELTGAEVILSTRDAPLVAKGGRGDFFLADRAPYTPVSADRMVENGDVVRLGSLSLTANITAGHTKGCTSWSADVAIAGRPHRLVVVCSLTVLDGYQLVGAAPSYSGIAADFCRSVGALRVLGADIFLAAHPSFFGMAEKASRLSKDRSAFVDPRGLHSYLDTALERIENTLAEQGKSDGCGG